MSGSRTEVSERVSVARRGREVFLPPGPDYLTVVRNEQVNPNWIRDRNLLFDQLMHGSKAKGLKFWLGAWSRDSGRIACDAGLEAVHIVNYLRDPEGMPYVLRLPDITKKDLDESIILAGGIPGSLSGDDKACRVWERTLLDYGHPYTSLVGSFCRGGRDTVPAVLSTLLLLNIGLAKEDS